MIDRRKAATRKLPMSSPTVEMSDFIRKRIYCIVLVFVMMFSMTAMAVEAEPVCTGECDHTHEETAIEPRWLCSNHNLAPYNDTEYQYWSASTHRFRVVSGDYCTNAGCEYKMVSYGNWLTEEHDNFYGECPKCGYAIG